MQAQFYNTLTHRLETFAPIEPPNVAMYNCGPTVYDYAHIGNFRTFIFGDLLRRFLELIGCRVHQVMNITDVGHMTDDQLADGGGQDKMQVASGRLMEAKKQGKLPHGAVKDPEDLNQIAQYYTDAFLEDAKALRLRIAEEYPQNMPRASHHITEMQGIIAKLIERGHAYVAEDGAVYFAVESFPAYGRLSGNTLEELRDGAGGRVRARHQASKRHPNDFLMWKPDAAHMMKWPSPWGTGYPGWHIECSAMAMHVLGRDVIDIHCGGEDNIFPHHECEIAQTCGATGNDYFARLWMHARFLLVDGEKMSKRKGSFFTVRDILTGGITGRPVEPVVLRYELSRTHYRSNLNFTRKGLLDAASAVRKIQDFARRLATQCGGAVDHVDLTHPVLADFTAALADDLNMSGALAVLFKWLAGSHMNGPESLGVLHRMDRILGVLDEPTGVPDIEQAGPNVRCTCQQIDMARVEKDYETADRLRKELIDAGYDVETTSEGTTARRPLA